jgi:predicted ribosome quality control (RQC) complex YloA/Tae2 family protein
MKAEHISIPCIGQSIEFRIGENAQDNFDIIDMSSPDDIWFHVNEMSSCHVIAVIPTDIKLSRKQLQKLITQGALLCKMNSKYKSVKKLNIIYSKLSNIVKTEVVGQVNVVDGKIIEI